MKKICTGICAILLFFAVLSFAAEKDDAVIAKERAMWEFVKTGDLKSFAANLSDNMTNVEPDGRIMSKSEMMQNLGKFKMESYNLPDIKVHWLNEQTALLTYKVTVNGMADNQQVNGDFRCSSIWVKEGNNWIGHFHQETPVAPMTEMKE